MITRPIEQKLREKILAANSTDRNNVLIIEGARQVGKTSLIEKILLSASDSVTINLEDRRDIRALIDQTTRFEEFQIILEGNSRFNPGKSQILFIDEAQESSQLGSYVRFMKERWPNIKVILTGSSMSKLFNKEQRIPVGRFIRYLVTPFSFREFLISLGRLSLIEILDNFHIDNNISDIVHLELLKHVDQYIATGGLPEVVTYFANDQDWKKLRYSILASQADDFIRKTEFQHPSIFLKALQGVANNLGFPAKYTHLNENIALAKELADQLKEWHLIYEVEQKGNASTTNFFPKRYIYDLGIAHDLRKMPFPSLSIIGTSNLVLRGQLGGVFENLVLSQLTNNQLEFPHLSGWKKNSQDGVEVAFILNDSITLPIEIKASKNIGPSNFKSVISYLNATDLKIGLIVSNDTFKVFKRGGLTLINLPIYCAEKSVIDKMIEKLLAA